MNQKLQNDLSDRLQNFAVEIVKIVEPLGKTFVGRKISGQLIDSSTSAGANYEEAWGAESTRGFYPQTSSQLVLKELRESLYWLRLILRAELMPIGKLDGAIKEGGELANIIAKSIVTARRNKKGGRMPV
jgi:four helix bundle protein